MSISFRIALAVIGSALLIGCGSESPSQHTAAAQSVASSAPSTAAPPSGTSDPVREAPITDRSLAEHIADARIEARVTAALVDQARLRTFDFTPAVVRGRLTLTGDVNTRAQHQFAARTAQQVTGVKQLSNNVTVQGQAVDARRDETSPSDAVAASESASVEQGTYHTVEPGETLWRIAQTYQASVDRIKSLNELRGNELEVGQRIRIR